MKICVVLRNRSRASNSTSAIPSFESPLECTFHSFERILISDCSPTCACSPTPLRGPKIVPFLKLGFGWIAFSIYRGGAADARGVGALTIRMDRQM
jgi:hypothetical protein